MSKSSEKARKYSRDHSERFRHELLEFLRIPSLSGDPAHTDDVKRAGEWLAAQLHALGIKSAKVMPTGGHPVVYAEWMGAGPDKPTVLVYGHYDVVPAVMEDGWDTPPFEPVEKGGKIYARGATDDKGQLFIHVKALEQLPIVPLPQNGGSMATTRARPRFYRGGKTLSLPSHRHSAAYDTFLTYDKLPRLEQVFCRLPPC